MKSYLKRQLALEVENLKFCMNIWILEKIVKISNMNFIKIRKDRCTSYSAFTMLFVNCIKTRKETYWFWPVISFLILVKTWFTTEDTAWLYNLSNSTVSTQKHNNIGKFYIL